MFALLAALSALALAVVTSASPIPCDSHSHSFPALPTGTSTGTAIDVSATIGPTGTDVSIPIGTPTSILPSIPAGLPTGSSILPSIPAGVPTGPILPVDPIPTSSSGTGIVLSIGGGGLPTGVLTIGGGGNPGHTVEPTATALPTEGWPAPSSSSPAPPSPSSDPSSGSSSGSGSGSGSGNGNGSGNGGTCSTGTIHCCNDTIQSNSDKGRALAGLLALEGDYSGIFGQNCSNLDVVAIGSGQCNAQTVCCESGRQTGLVNVGCVPVTL